MSEPNIVTDGLVKDFGDVRAVEDVSFEIEEGEFFALLGPSGCGKTTTLRMIAGFERPTEGDVYIDGDRVNDVPPYHRNVGMVFQNYALFPHKTVGENVGFGLKMQGVPEEERRERVADILELVDLPGTQERAPSELSGGQQQRVALARALVIEPEVLLLDEPLANLDKQLRQQMRVELKRIQGEFGITTIYVTHDQEEALSLSDRILVMNDGYAEQVSTPLDLYNQPENEFVANFIGDSNLLRGRVAARNETTVEVDLSDIDQGPVSVDSEAASDGTDEGDAVTVNVRPEDVTVRKTNGDDAAEGQTVRGRVKNKTFLGNVTHLIVDIDGEEVMVEAPGRAGQRQFATGEDVALEWNAEDCLVIGEDG